MKNICVFALFIIIGCAAVHSAPALAELELRMAALKRGLNDRGADCRAIGKNDTGDGLTLRARMVTPDALQFMAQFPITELVLTDCPSLTTVSPLEGMPISMLVLTDSRIAKLDILKTLPLEALYIEGTPVSDISPLADIKTLRFLSASETHIKSVEALGRLALTSLSIARCQVTDLSPIRGRRLQSLSIAGCPVKSIGFVKGMPLKDLNVSRTKITDITPLKGMKDLSELNVSYTGITNLAALKGLSLTRLDISGTAIADLSDLRGMSLDCLFMRRMKSENISGLRDVKSKRVVVDRDFPTDHLSKIKSISEIEIVD